MMRHLLLSALAVGSLSGCQTLPPEPPTLEGPIVARDVRTSISDDARTIHVREAGDECGIIFSVRWRTKIVRRTADGRTRGASVAELTPGARVRVWSEVVLDSCPGQAGATAVEILPGDAPETTFAAELVRPGSGGVPELAVRGGPGRIEVTGAIGTPVPCYRVTGAFAFEGGAIRLRVIATPREVTCITVAATFAYQAAVQGLAPGRYTVFVEHERQGAGEIVLEDEVEVG